MPPLLVSAGPAGPVCDRAWRDGGARAGVGSAALLMAAALCRAILKMTRTWSIISVSSRTCSGTDSGDDNTNECSSDGGSDSGADDLHNLTVSVERENNDL